MSYISIGEEPELDFGGVNILEKFPERGVREEDIFEGDRIVDLAVVLYWVDLVVANETFDCKTIALITES